jgi:polar amino acid transport system substrate-binding protein
MREGKSLILSLILLGTISLSSAQETVSITVGEWPPYVSAELVDYGIAPRIVTAAFNTQKVKATYVFSPWTRAFENAKNGGNDATLLWVRTEEREKYFVFSDVVITGKAVFFHLKSKQFSWKTMDDLVGLNIGGLKSGSYPWFDDAVKAGKNLKMDRVNDEITNFKKLLTGRIDVFSLDQLTGASVLKRNFSDTEIDKVTFDPNPIESWNYCLLFSKKSPKAELMVNLFNRGLKELKQSGKFNKLAE